MNLNTKLDHITFEFGGQQIWAKYRDHMTNVIFLVTWIVYVEVVSKVKLQCVAIVEKLIFELGNHFPSHELMDSLNNKSKSTTNDIGNLA
jgi:hypothetical protein